MLHARFFSRSSIDVIGADVGLGGQGGVGGGDASGAAHEGLAGIGVTEEGGAQILEGPEQVGAAAGDGDGAVADVEGAVEGAPDGDGAVGPVRPDATPAADVDEDIGEGEVGVGRDPPARAALRAAPLPADPAISGRWPP